ncbi:MAG: hypothetical protein ACO20H_13610 [Bacteriovoracaceae bacterium]
MKKLIFLNMLLLSSSVFAFGGGDGSGTFGSGGTNGGGGTDVTSSRFFTGENFGNEVHDIRELLGVERPSLYRDVEFTPINEINNFRRIGAPSSERLINTIFDNRNLGRSVNINNFSEYLNHNSI